MKSKKLFAIVTLVMFMMTLLPMAAFGYSAAASEVKASNTSIEIYSDSDDLAKLTITFKESGSALATGTAVLFYVKSDRDAEFGYVDGGTDVDLYGNDGALDIHDGDNMSEPEGQAVSTTVLAGGKVYVYVGSDTKGTFTLSIYNQDNADDGMLIGSADITVSVGDGAVDLVAVNEEPDPDETYNDEDPDVVDPLTINTANAGDGIELTATVEDGGTAIEGKTVTFQAKYEGGSWYNIATDVTDEDGEAKYYFEETKAGTYQFRAKYDDEVSGVIKIKYSALAATKTIELKTADGKKIAKGEVNNLDFYVKDKYGNLKKAFDDYTSYDVKVESAPAGSKFEDMDWDNPSSGDIVTTDDKEDDGVLRVKFKPDKEGKYVIKVRDAEETRVTAAIEVEAIKFGDAVSMKLKVQNTKGEDVTSLTRVYETDEYNKDHDYVAGELIVTLVNASGVELDTTSDLQFASSNISKVKFADTSVGDITIKADAIGTYTLTAYYSEDNLTGTYELNVVGSPRALVATPTVTDLTASVALQYIDANGNNTWVVNADGTVPDEGYQIVVPSGVTASNVKDIKKTGAGSFDLKADAAGTYSITVITSVKGIAKTFDVTFAAPAGTMPAVGAKNVTMFIGATGYVQDGVAKVTDVAPFIQDGRTFVAVRPVADAFGCEIGWNEATQTVTLTRSDMTVTIVIGSNVITVVKDGVTSTVTADVAAFIKDGRTVLPFRAVGDAFGATVDYDAATQAVSYAQ